MLRKAKNPEVDLSSEDDDAEEEEEQGPEVADIESKKTKKDMPELQVFQDHLTDPIGLIKSELTAKQHVSQVIHLLDVLPGQSLMEKLSLSHFVPKLRPHRGEMSKKYKPGTIRSYMGSMRIFLDFCLQEDYLDSSSAFRIKQYTQNWYTSLKDRVAERKHGVKNATDEIMETTDLREMRLKYTSSQKYRDSIKALGSSKPPKEGVEEREFVLARNHLMTEVLMYNATRPGAIKNMKVEEFRKARPKDDTMVISVRMHKTFRTHGHSRLVVDEHLHRQMTLYDENMRPCKAKCTYFFCD